MKNFNLIKRLWTDSHEKQSPQRFGRYAAMLIMLLTIGVGQMWARTYSNEEILYVKNIKPSGWGDPWKTSSGVMWAVFSGATGTKVVGQRLTGDDGAVNTIYAFQVPNGTHTTVTLYRGSSTSSEWNHTNAITLDASKNYISAGYNANASTATWSTISMFEKDKYLYLLPTTNWKSSSAKFEMYFYDGVHSEWVSLAQEGSTDYWYGKVPSRNWPYVIFVRMNPSGPAHSWDGKWNQTQDLAPVSGRNYCKTTDNNSWNDGSFQSSPHVTTLSASSIEDNGSTLYGGDGTTSGTAYLIEKSTSLKVKASATKVVADPDAAIYYNIKDGSTSKQNSTTATYSFTASSTANTTHQMKVDAYAKISSTSGTPLTSSIVYYKTVTCYTVTYDDNDASSGSVPAVSGSKYVSGSNVTLATNTGSLAKSGYSFNGWNTRADGEGTHYDAGGTLSGISGNVTLYAEWSAEPGVSLAAAKISGINVGETVRLTATGSNASNITKYDFYEGSTKVYTATTSSGTATYDYTPSVAGAKTMKVIMTYNSGSNTVTSNNVGLTLNTPSVSSLTEANSTTQMWIGVDATAALTFTAASSNVSSGATVTWSASDASSGTFNVTSSSYSGATITYTPASTGAKTVTVTMSIGGNNYTRTYNLTVYERWNIYVQNNCSWSAVALYQYGNGTNAGWPGVTGASTACEPYTPKWYKVTLDSYYPYFILDNNVSGSGQEQLPGGNAVATNKGTYAANTYWDFNYTGTTDGVKYYELHSVSPSVPTVSISSYEVISSTQIKLTGTISNYGSDGSSAASHMKEVGFYCGETKHSTTHTSSNTFTKVITGLTAGTEYSFKAYAINVKGEGKSSAQAVTTRAGGTYTIKVRTAVGATAPKIYAWTAADANDGVKEENATYGSGAAMTAAITGTVYKWWSYDLNKTYNNFLIYETGDGNKTNDISAPQAATCYWYNSSNAIASRYGTMDCPHTTPQLYVETTAGGGVYEYYEMSGTTTISKSLTLAAKSTYKFKIFYSGEYFGKSATATRASNTVDDLSASVDTYVQVTTDVAGSYTFAFTTGGKDLTITYPTAYTVTFGKGTGGSTITATATSAGGSISSGNYVASGDDITFTQTEATGYTFKGWYDAASAGSAIACMASDNVYDDIAGNINVYAQYNAKTYAVTFDYSTNGGSKTSGADANNATFDQNTITTPVVYKDGYCLDGWYSAASDGVKVIDASGNLQPNVSVSATTWTDGTGKWKKDGTAKVYAVYVVPTIEMTPTPRVLNVKTPEKDTVVIHQTFSCTPTGTYNVAYTVGYSANHTQLAPQPTIKYGTGGSVGYDTIKMPMSANTYEIVATLRTGSTRGSGTVIKRDTIDYAVEDEYSVTLTYLVDGVQIRSSRNVSAYPSATETPTEVRVAVEESGYVLDHWELGVGIDTVSGRGSTIDGGILGDLESKYIYAANNGNIYLHYKPKANTVYFFNTFEMYWYSTIMKKYDYGTSTSYWANTYGAGSKTGPSTGQITPDTVKMTTLDLEEKRWMASIGGSTTNFAFVSEKKDQEHFWGEVEGNKYPKVIYRTDYNAATPMFVPVATDVTSDYYILNKNDGGEAHYYRGFWVKYSPNPDSTGYYLHVYNQKAQSGAKLIQTLPLRLSQTGADGTWELRAVMDLEGGKTYGFKITKATGASSKTWYSYNGTLTAADHEGKVLDGTSDNIGLTTTTAGDYTFHVFCKDFGTIAANNATAAQVQGQLAVTVDYATVSGDYRVIYSDATQTEVIASPSIHPAANGQDTVSFFIRKNSASRVMKIQKFTSDWADVSTIDLSTIAKDSVYVIYLQQNEAMTSIEATGIDFYSGDFYIRTDCVDEHKWDYKQSLDNHRMNPSDYGLTAIQPVKFSHYYVHWIDEGGNVKFVVANKYAPCISDTLITDTYANGAGGCLPSDGDAGTNIGANVRFMYNKGTNAVTRAYLAGAQGVAYDPDFLKVSTATEKMGTTDATPSVIYEKTFTDEKNWIYQAAIKAKPGLTGTLTAKYNGNTQYFIGSSSEEEQLIGGTGDEWQQILLTYDFKVNRLICAWQPSGDSINGDNPINADVMVIRVGQEDAQQIIFKNNDSKLSSVKYIYSVMQFNYDDMVGKMYTWSPTAYEFCMYYISFPYDVLVNDIMAPGRMGSEWRLQRYNGAKRAEGWFAGDGVTTFWEDVQSGDTLKAYEGYSLLLNRRIFNDGSSSVWQNKGARSKLYMYFPSKDATTGVVANKSVNVAVPSHECTVDRVFEQDKNKPTAEQRNHKVVDSHWNMIGTPLFEDRTASTIATGPEVEGETLQYIYAWNPAGNTLGVRYALTSSWKFRTMYSYMAQYTGTITFQGSAVNKIVAANRAKESKNYTLNLELFNEDAFIGRTYVELRENAVDSFLLNEDVYMIKNGVNADLYTFAGPYEAGANVLSVDNHIVPVGIDVKVAGTYTFSMPDDFDGEVVLVDNYAQTRTNLLLEDYEIALPKGSITDRFQVEINIRKVPTSIDGVEDGSLKDGKAHKYIEYDKMYILQNGVIYDAQGKRVK